MKTLTRFFFLMVVLSVSVLSQKNDFFLMGGSSFVRPGWKGKANVNVGYGRIFESLDGFLLGNEITASYTYENAGEGFFGANYATHTSTAGVMRMFDLSKRYAVYTWPVIGMTSMTGGGKVQNRLYAGAGLGFVIRLREGNSIWIQPTYNKVASYPAYASLGIGYVFSW